MNGSQETPALWLDREEACRAIKSMTRDDLIFLNTQIIERLKLLDQARDTVEMARLSLGDRVRFCDNAGRPQQGTVVKLNKKTAGVQTADGRHWRISPGLLEPL